MIDGLSIKSLKGLAGEGSYSVKWNAAETQIGDYYAELVITDASGDILDSKTAGFSMRPADILEIPPETTWVPTETIKTPTAAEPTDALGKLGEFPTIYIIIGAILVVAAVTNTLDNQVKK